MWRLVDRLPWDKIWNNNYNELTLKLIYALKAWCKMLKKDWTKDKILSNSLCKFNNKDSKKDSKKWRVKKYWTLNDNNLFNLIWS
jgi:hypothetical protein